MKLLELIRNARNRRRIRRRCRSAGDYIDEVARLDHDADQLRLLIAVKDQAIHELERENAMLGQVCAKQRKIIMEMKRARN